MDASYSLLQNRVYEIFFFFYVCIRGIQNRTNFVLRKINVLINIRLFTTPVSRIRKTQWDVWKKILRILQKKKKTTRIFTDVPSVFLHVSPKRIRSRLVCITHATVASLADSYGPRVRVTVRINPAITD